ncbi:MAG: hypothetical protein BroJett029_28620 [Alphaproteobacteria bacterium]|nr:MAG: hypothetical protein BroJett029_28620 [Alphaproteobacteria bacterium]
MGIPSRSPHFLTPSRPAVAETSARKNGRGAELVPITPSLYPLTQLPPSLGCAELRRASRLGSGYALAKPAQPSPPKRGRGKGEGVLRRHEREMLR